LVKAVAVAENAKASPVVFEEFKAVKRNKLAATSPRTSDIGPGGIGMLIKSVRENGIVLVEDLTLGEPAAQCGRIRIGDRLLVVNGIEVSPYNFDQISAMIPGPPGTRVDLQLVQATVQGAVHSPSILASDPEHLRGLGLVYSVSLIRAVLSGSRSTFSSPKTQTQSEDEGLRRLQVV
jgi:hypothetical protein